MMLLDVYWSLPVNRLVIQCDCGITFDAASNYSVVRCPRRGKVELWHSVDPRASSGPWSLPVMQHGSILHGR
jgi:hypothetical protein